MDDRVQIALSLIQSLAFPFAYPDQHSLFDWHTRGTTIVDLSEFLEVKANEMPFRKSHPMETPEYGHPDAVSFLAEETGFEYATHARESFPEGGYRNLIDYSRVDKSSVSNEDVYRMFAGVLSVEKLAISACSRAIVKFALPVQAVLALTSIIRDECLHLLSMSRLISGDPMEGGWITDRRRAEWEQLCKCQTALDSVLLQHCLFEGEGSFASNYGVYSAEKANFPAPALSVIRRVAEEETRHVSVGYFLANLLSKKDAERKGAVRRVVSLLREIEPLEPNNAGKFHKQMIAEETLQSFGESGDWMGAIEKTLNHAHLARQGLFA